MASDTPPSPPLPAEGSLCRQVLTRTTTTTTTTTTSTTTTTNSSTTTSDMVREENSVFVQRLLTPESRVISLPFTGPPLPVRTVVLHPSIISQLDGLVFALRGVRLERDVLATSCTSSLLPRWGLKPYESAATEFCLYLHNFNLMPEIVASAVTHRAAGLFLVRSTLAEPASFRSKKTSRPWLDFLLKTDALVFPIDPRGVTQDSHPVHGVVAVVARFGLNSPFKQKRRPERSVSVSVQDGGTSRSVGVVPRLWHRFSPLADPQGTAPMPDSAPASPSFSTEGRPPSRPRKSPWPVEKFKTLAQSYPWPEVVKLATEVMAGSFDPFVGDRSKAVDFQDRVYLPGQEEIIYDLLMKQVKCDPPLFAGPFVSPSCANARPWPPGLTPKHKYRASGAFRLTSDYSAGSTSVNDLTWNPKFLAVHFSARLLRDAVAAAGPGVLVSLRDVPKAFKMNPANPDLAFLHCTRVLSQVHGTCYFDSLANDFGWIAAEFGWQAALALITWVLSERGVRDFYAFVDNFFIIHMPGSPVQAQAARFDSIMREMGIDLHECSTGSSFLALGWEWDLAAKGKFMMIMKCPDDKMAAFSRCLSEAAVAPSISRKSIEQIEGILHWLSMGLPSLRSVVPALSASRYAQGSGGKKHLSSPVKMGPEVKAAVRYSASLVLAWDGTCPIVQGFGPTAGPQVFGWVDASTKWGMGGIIWIPSSNGSPAVLRGFAVAWSEAERIDARGPTRESTGVFEAMAIARWLSLFGHLCTAKRVLLHTDSEAAMQATRKAFSCIPAMLRQVVQSRAVVAREFIVLRISSVVGVLSNIIADLLSHNNLSQAACVALKLFQCQLSMVP